MRNAAAILLALLAGMVLAGFDTRTDDTGIEVGLILMAATALSFMAPRLWWAIALLVGGFIPLVEMLRSPAPGAGIPAGVAALGVALIGALIGTMIARAARAASTA